MVEELEMRLSEKKNWPVKMVLWFRMGLGVWLLGLALRGVGAEELFFDFGKAKVNEVPVGFLSAVAGEGKPGQWVVIEAEAPFTIPTLTPNAPVPKRRVLAQISTDPTDEHYPLLIYTNETFGDFTFTTRFKTVSGQVEQMAGIVFRYEDENNYYYLRASSKGNTFRFFKVVNGQRSPAIGPQIEIPSGVWHELSVECKGNTLIFRLNGKQVIPTATDNSFSAGKIGFWTKSDSVSYFTDARVSYTLRETFAKVVLRRMKEKYPRVLALRLYGASSAQEEVRVQASTDESELGKAGTEVERNVIERGVPYAGKISTGYVVTLPVQDRNGDIVAALRVEMKSFPGQTENNALTRALPIAKDIESQMTGIRELF